MAITLIQTCNIVFAYQIAIGGAVEYTGVGNGGYAISMITQYLPSSNPQIKLSIDALFFGMT